MPEREFEIYLSVLSRLLTLTPEQTAAISDELRDHLEERFEELVRSGIERDDAIKQALDEFGDASGLAVNLTRVSQKPIRRWVIGSSIVSAVAVLIAIAAFLISDPDASSLPGATQAIAQSDAASPQPIDPQSLLLAPQPDDLELPQLSNPCSINFVEDFPLDDALDFLAREHEVPIVIDPLILADGIITADQPLNVPPLGRAVGDADVEASANWPHQVTLAQVFDVMFRGMDLTWYVQDGIITVTSIEQHDERCFARSYNIEPLIRTGIASDTFTTTVQQITRSDWEVVDGAGGNISLIGNVLTVRQTYQAHREVRQLLLKLATSGGSPWVDYAAERESLAVVLREPASADFVEDCPLQDFADFFSREMGVPVLIDWNNLHETGIATDQPVNVPPIAAVPFEAVLRLALDEFDLSLVLQHGIPTITTVEIANERDLQATAVYNVAPLLKSGVDSSELIGALLSSAGGTWEEVDGDGGALTLTENGLLVVSQAAATHRSIQRLLQIWERTQDGDRPSVPLVSTPVTKFYHMPIETAESLKTVIPEMVAPESWKSDANPNGGTIHAVALARDPVKETSPEKKTSDEPTSKNPQKPAEGSKAAWIGEQPPVVLAQFGGMGGGGFGGGGVGGSGEVLGFYSKATGVLIITQTPAVHREIDRFLASLRVSTRGHNEARDGEVATGGGVGGGFF